MPKRTLEVTLPQMGESVTEGVVGSWRKHVGDQVMAGEALVEVQTDKIDAEVPAPESGLLTRILAEEGATVAIGGGLAEIELGATSNGQPPRDSDPTALAGAEQSARAEAPAAALEVVGSPELPPPAPGAPAEVISVALPALGESVTEGVIGSWLKRVGDAINVGDTLVEIQTDKVDAEVPSPVTGVLLEILVPEGETVAAGTILARVSGSTPAASTGAGPAAATSASLPITSSTSCPPRRRKSPAAAFRSPGQT